jgi:hypothetical protein
MRRRLAQAPRVMAEGLQRSSCFAPAAWLTLGRCRRHAS